MLDALRLALWVVTTFEYIVLKIYLNKSTAYEIIVIRRRVRIPKLGVYKEMSNRASVKFQKTFLFLLGSNELFSIIGECTPRFTPQESLFYR